LSRSGAGVCITFRGAGSSIALFPQNEFTTPTTPFMIFWAVVDNKRYCKLNAARLSKRRVRKFDGEREKCSKRENDQMSFAVIHDPITRYQAC